MTWPWMCIGFALGTGLGYGLGRAKKRDATRTNEHPHPASPSWLERHQRLRDSAGIAAKNVDVRAKRKQAKHHTLQMQLSPHFMFNALSSVQWLWADSKHDQARDSFASFVHLWRKHWTDTSSTSHSLRKELASLEEYVHLETSRRGTPVDWRIDIVSPVNLEAHVPPLLFQPALENALWHGFAKMPNNPSLLVAIESIESEHSGNWIAFQVRDNGVGLPPATLDQPSKRRGSMGLSITRDRLRALHPHASVEVANAPHPWSTETTFVLPTIVPGS